MTRPVLVGIHDLILSAKVHSVARALGIPAMTTFTPHDLLSKAHGEDAALIIIDLNEETLHPEESIKQIKSDPHTRAIPVVGFITKHDDKRMKTALEYGCDFVMGQSQFIESLTDILSGKLTQATSA